MKVTTIFSVVLNIILILCSIKAYADESRTDEKNANESHAVHRLLDSEAYRYLAIKSSPVNPLLFVHNLAITSVGSSQSEELPTHISAKFHSQLLSIKAGVIQSDQTSNWRKYYFQGVVTLHQFNKFNLSLMANIEQLSNVHSLYVVNNEGQTSYVENFPIRNDTELNYSYGLIGSYSVNATWLFSGGIIHAQAFDKGNSNTEHSNKNMALIGTTYSF